MLEQALQNAQFSQQDEHQAISCINSKITTNIAEIYQQDDATVDV
jgi:PmbA protein